MIAAPVGAVASISHHAPVVVARSFQLPAGRTHARFNFRVDAKFPDRARLVVSRDTRVSVAAHSRDRDMQLWIATRPWTMWWHQRWAGHCRHARGRDVCTEEFEHCPLVRGPWTATVRKTSASPAFVRVRFVFVR